MFCLQALSSVVHFSNYFFDSSECSSVLGSSGCTNRWNLGLWRHLLDISFLLLIIFPGSFTHKWKIASFSWLHRWHLGVPNVGTHVTGFACHSLLIVQVLRINLVEGLGKLWRMCAWWAANESDFSPFLIKSWTSVWCCCIRAFNVCCVDPM